MFAYFTAPNGDRVSAVQYDERASLPLFSVEVVRAGEVVELIEPVFGHTGLMALAQRRRWTTAS